MGRIQGESFEQGSDIVGFMAAGLLNKTVRVHAILFALVMVSACEKTYELRLADTEGRSFQAVCKGADCSISSMGQAAAPSSSKPEGAKPAFVLHNASRLFAICEVWVQGNSHTVHPADCRALTCKADADCPWALNMTKGTCTNELCIEPSAEINHEDAVLFCLMGTGPPANTNAQIERYSLGNTCGSPCHVPAVCRQP